MTLDQIAISYGTDKASQHSVKGHNYCVHYANFFDPIRHDAIKLLEIGVGGAQSIRTWIEYFPNAKVYGVDIVHDTNPWNTVGSGIHPRYTFITGDQSSEVFWKCFEADYGKDWSVVIDDGGHYSNQIITSFNALWPLVVHGGLYCVEDLGVAYGGSMFVPEKSMNHMDWIGKQMEAINLSNDIESMHFSKELAIFRKSGVTNGLAKSHE